MRCRGRSGVPHGRKTGRAQGNNSNTSSNGRRSGQNEGRAYDSRYYCTTTLHATHARRMKYSDVAAAGHGGANSCLASHESFDQSNNLDFYSTNGSTPVCANLGRGGTRENRTVHSIRSKYTVLLIQHESHHCSRKSARLLTNAKNNTNKNKIRATLPPPSNHT